MNNAFERSCRKLRFSRLLGTLVLLRKGATRRQFTRRTFIIRNELFCMAAAGEIGFESTSYIELRYLINGMLRFGHHISLRSSFIASQLSEIDPDKSSAYLRWKASVNGETEEVRTKLTAIHHRMFRAYINYLVYGSIFLTMAKVVFLIKAGIKAACTHFISKNTPTRFDLIDIAVNKIANGVHAQALEEQAYRDQSDSHDLQIA